MCKQVVDLQDTAPTPLHVELLGNLRIIYGGAPVTAIHSPRLQALLAYLILHRAAPQARRHLAYLFWPDSSEGQARTNLRHLLHDLQHALPDDETLLTTDSQTVQWQPTLPVTLDVAEFERAAAATARAELEGAVALYRGALLPGCYDDWIRPERERLHRLCASTLERLIALAEAEHDLAGAIAGAEHLVRHDPMHEAAYRTLMRLHGLNGDRAAALHVYHRCASMLRRELGVPPDAATLALHQDLLTADVDDADPAGRPAPDRYPLVGRAADCALLHAIWRSARASNPQMVVLTGDAGIGKSRLAEELAAWVSRHDPATLTVTARGYAAEGDLPYAPVASWLRARPLPALDNVWLTEIARLLPELLTAHPALPSPEPLQQAWQRHRLFEALARALLGDRRPRLLILDDLQWCDRDTLAWLHYLLRFDPAAPLLLAGTLRTGESAPPGLATLLDGLRRDSLVAELEVGPLDATATTALAGHVAGHPLDAELAEPLFRGSEGNPLFVVEMIQAGLAQPSRTGERWSGEHAGTAGTSAQPLPARVRQVLERRLAQLSPAALELAELAATIGRRFDFACLHAAADAPEADVVRQLDELWRRRIVREHGADGYDFSHDKLRETAYQGLSAARRRLLHRRVAGALESLHAGALDGVSGQIGRHYEQAGLAAPAITYYCRAAQASQQVYDAREDAITFYRRALALLGEAPHNDPATAAHVWELLGDVLHLTAQYEPAREAFQHALSLLDTADKVTQADLYRKLGNTWREERSYAMARQVYDAGLQWLGEPPAGHAAGQDHADTSERRWWQRWIDLQLEIVQTHYWIGESRQALAAMNAMRAAVDHYAGAVQRVHFFMQYATLQWQQERFAPTPQTEAYLREAQRALVDSPEAQQTPSVIFRLGFLLLWHDMLAAAETKILAALAWAERSIDLTLLVRCLVYLGVVYRRQDRPDDVRACAARTLELATAAHMPEYVATARANLAWLAWRAGDLAAVDDHGRAALALWAELEPGHPSTPYQWTALWPLLAAEASRGALQQAVVCARTLLLPTQQRLPAALADPLARAVDAHRAGDLPSAQQWLQQALDAAARQHYL